MSLCLYLFAKIKFFFFSWAITDKYPTVRSLLMAFGANGSDETKEKLLAGIPYVRAHHMFSRILNFLFTYDWFFREKNCLFDRNGILLPKLFFGNSRLKAKNLQNNFWSLEQFIQIVKGQNNVRNRIIFNLFLDVSQI